VEKKLSKNLGYFGKFLKMQNVDNGTKSENSSTLVTLVKVKGIHFDQLQFLVHRFFCSLLLSWTGKGTWPFLFYFVALFGMEWARVWLNMTLRGREGGGAARSAEACSWKVKPALA
jgi:hypothetical protein